MERNGHFQPENNAGRLRTQQAHVTGTAKDQRDQQSAVSCHQAPCKSPLPPHQVSAELQALAIAYNMMLEQQEHFRIMASISGTTAAWNAIYNDRFAEEDARLKAECQRLLGLQRNTIGSHSSPESAIHFIEQSTCDLLQAERGRRPYPVDQETVAEDRRSRSAEGGHPQLQLDTKTDANVEAKIPDQLVSTQSSLDTSSITLNCIDDVTCTVGGSQLESQSLKQIHSDSSITGNLKQETSFHIPTAKWGCLPISVNTPRKPVKTTRSHRLRLRPKTRWKTTLSATPSPSLNSRFFVILSLSSVFTINNKNSGEKRQHTSENFICSPSVQHHLGSSTIINITNINGSPGSSTVLHHVDLR